MRKSHVKLKKVAILLFGVVMTSSFFAHWITRKIHIPQYIHDSKQETGDFLVETEACRIPDLDPFDSSIEEHIRLAKGIQCFAKPSITFQDGDMLRLNWTTIYQSYKGDFSHCKYQGIRRGEKMSDEHFIYTDLSEEFHADVKMSEEFIRVYCFSTSGGKIYTNFHALIIPNPTRLEELKKRLRRHVNTRKSRETLNVVMIGVDSVSRLNNVRNMPKTRDYLLRHLDAIELQGYTKVADNTFVNIVPMTTGQFVEELPWNETKRMEPFDKYNFIWKNFASNGYSTMYAEDAPKMAIFTYLKKGFHNPPADYYNRPFSVAMEKHPSVWNHGHQCVGDRLETDILLDYSRDFAKMNKNHPYFAFAFITRLTHDVLSNAGLADDVYYKRLGQFYKDGLFNNSVVILFSDHGQRFGSFRESYIGKLEERLPMMFLIFPKWFYKKYPQITKNLKINQNRLTTPFDIYETLKDILYFTGDVKGDVDVKQRGISLFEEIPTSRSCDHAGILPHWCVCMMQEQLPVDHRFSRLSVKYLISEINRQIFHYRDLCARLVLGHIKSVHILKNNDQLLRFDHSSNDVINRTVVYGKRTSMVTLFQVAVVLVPGASVFEATIKYDEMTRMFSPAGDVSRINRYGNQGDCIDESHLRKYCFCFV
ncbi:uncharacterized protein LOC126829361 [Patella vulgata]|uniref:uncharacterized protein LOC126829361 n=1 Tax=Patella vulgata TaxID=6465 RepID=UPI0024A9710A|nr:uncharacterized protein LOC126829361 [Patella vulgata]